MFPAQAGMNLHLSAAGRRGMGVPRAGGDEPHEFGVATAAVVFAGLSSEPTFGLVFANVPDGTGRPADNGSGSPNRVALLLS